MRSPSFSSRWISIQETIEAPECAQVGEGLGELLGAGETMISALLDGDRRRGLDPVQDEGIGHFLDEVHDIVEPADEGVNVLSVEWCDERPLQLLTDVMADRVAGDVRVAAGTQAVRGHPRSGRASVRARAAATMLAASCTKKSKNLFSRGIRGKRTTTHLSHGDGCGAPAQYPIRRCAGSTPNRA